MRKKILYCATVDYHFKAFHLPYMKWFQEQGWEVHVAARGDMKLPYCDRKYNISMERSPIKLGNVKAYRDLKRIMDQNGYDIVHAHTPMGGVLARLAARDARKSGTKVLYTAHGFHFYKGSPLTNWIVYYPLERWLSHYTDCLITINYEDYRLASKHKFKAGSIEHVHGVGVDTVRFSPVSHSERNRLRERHGYREEDFLLYYVAELNKNKNQGLLIKAVAKARHKIPTIRLLLVGDGHMGKYYRKLAEKLGVNDVVDFLGFRKDVDEFAKMCNVAVAGSLREGLPVNIIEAMACGRPVIARDNRGHRELVMDGVTGRLVSENSADRFSQYIIELYEHRDKIEFMGEKAREHVLNTYSLDSAAGEMIRIYQRYGCEADEAVGQCDSTCVQCGGISAGMPGQHPVTDIKKN